jgi:radical SAM superfamily enzyme YgiQ (UPF0313 family)
MNILLIYPGLVEGFDSYKRGADWFNHGIGILTAIARRGGHHVRYVDCRMMKDWPAFESEVAREPYDVAMISIATVDFSASRRMAAILKRTRPEAPVIVGGPHPTLMTEETASVPDFDVIFTHEAEITLPALLADLRNAPRVIRGEMPDNLDSLPFVDRSLAPEGETPWFKGLERPFFSITASRGCIYKCTFCQPAERQVFGDRVRKRTVDNILDELEMLASKYGMKSFMIHDDCFTQYYDWVEEFCEKKQRRGINQPFVCQTRADIVCRRPDLMKSLKDVGLRWVLIGFESGSDRVLQFIKKGTTVAQNLEAGTICKSLGIDIFANYMFGLPAETRAEMEETVRMIRQIGPAIHSPSIFTPAPGSELYEYCREHDLSLITSSEDYRRDPDSGAKIKGVDYRFIDSCIEKSLRDSPKDWVYHVFVRKMLKRGILNAGLLTSLRKMWG